MGEGRFNAADDVIGTLSARVTELSKRVALLEAELQSAEKRIEIYEDHDSQIQDALSGALKAAYQIRQRAETAAEQILEQAREQRRMILTEIERLQDERDRLQDEIATGRRSSIAPVASRPLSSETAASELRAVASEALKGLFEEIVEDMRAAHGRAAPPPAPRAPAEVPPREVPDTGRERPVVTREDIETVAPTYEAMARMRRSTIEHEDIGAPAPIAEAPVVEPEPAPAPVEELEEIAAPETMRPISEGPSLEERQTEEQHETERRAAELRELEERAEAERAEAERVEAEERAEAERREATKRADRERLEAESRAAAEREAAARAETERAATQRAAAAARAEAERAVAAERAAVERAAAERAEAERAEAERAAAERAMAERAAAERATAERAAAERAIAERAAAEAAMAAATPPLEVVRTPVDMGEIAPPRVEAASPTSDIQLVLSPVASFPRLVEIERQIQALPVVRTLYVRDFRGGAATLAVALRSSMTPEEFAGLLRGLQQPRLRLVAGSRNTLEMRVEGEAGVA